MIRAASHGRRYGHCDLLPYQRQVPHDEAIAGQAAQAVAQVLGRHFVAEAADQEVQDQLDRSRGYLFAHTVAPGILVAPALRQHIEAGAR